MTAHAFVVRWDKALLTEETGVEGMYHFHVSLKLNYFEDKDGVHRLPNGLTLTDFWKLSEPRSDMPLLVTSCPQHDVLECSFGSSKSTQHHLTPLSIVR